MNRYYIRWRCHLWWQSINTNVFIASLFFVLLVSGHLSGLARKADQKKFGNGPVLPETPKSIIFRAISDPAPRENGQSPALFFRVKNAKAEKCWINVTECGDGDVCDDERRQKQENALPQWLRKIEPRPERQTRSGLTLWAQMKA